jgi:hypothetical protein
LVAPPLPLDTKVIRTDSAHLARKNFFLRRQLKRFAKRMNRNVGCPGTLLQLGAWADFKVGDPLVFDGEIPIEVMTLLVAIDDLLVTKTAARK